MSACAKCGHNPDAEVVAVCEFHIDREVHSLNAHSINAGAARFGYKRDRDAWQWEFRSKRLGDGTAKAISKRRVTLTRLIPYRGRAFDHDNLVGGCKVVVDAMVREGLLRGDTAEWAEISYDQVKRDGVSGLIVRIEELTP